MVMERDKRPLRQEGRMRAFSPSCSALKGERRMWRNKEEREGNYSSREHERKASFSVFNSFCSSVSVWASRKKEHWVSPFQVKVRIQLSVLTEFCITHLRRPPLSLLFVTADTFENNNTPSNYQEPQVQFDLHKNKTIRQMFKGCNRYKAGVI